MHALRNAIGIAVIASSVFTLVPHTVLAATQRAPSDLTLVNGIYTNDTTPTATWTRPTGATWYEFLLDDGDWQGIGNVGSYTLWTLPSGWHTFFLRAHNNTGGVSTSVSVTFEIDIQGPTVSTVSPNSAIEDEPVPFTVTASGEAAVTFCDLYVNGSNVGSMTQYSSTSFKTLYTFSNNGSYSVYARCTDGDGNDTIGSSRTVTVTKQHESDGGYGLPIHEGSLIKMQCTGSVRTNDPCIAVYYYGEDGKRHVFPNEATYFTWYNDFDDVVEVSSSFMSSLTIGKNVTFRPGSVLVKFDSSSSIYAVEKERTLRRYTTMSLVAADYGMNYHNALVTISDALYGNYVIGHAIDATNDFDRDDEYFSVDSIDDVL